MTILRKVIIADPTLVYTADVDQYDEGINQIDVIHHLTHDGQMFNVNNVATNIQTATPKRYFAITPNNSNTYHFSMKVTGDAEFLIELYETPTSSNNGTALTKNNLNRNSILTLDATFFQDPTVSVDGTLLQSEYVGADAGAARFGGDTRFPEWMLKNNTTYQIKITATNNGLNTTTNMQMYKF